MKKYALPLAVASMLVLQACNEQTTAPDAAVETAAPVSLETSQQRLSYGIAYGLGERMRADSVPLDVDAFTLGLRDALAGDQPRLSKEDIAVEMQAYQEKAQTEQQATQALAAEANVAAAEEFLAENAALEGVVVTETGLQYKILEAGEGALPGADDTVEVHYRCRPSSISANLWSTRAA